MKLKKCLMDLIWISYVKWDYFLLFRKFPKSVELTDKKKRVRINGNLCAFKSKHFYPYEIIEEVDKITWDKHFAHLKLEDSNIPNDE